MNKVILMGRLVRDPEVRYTNNENATATARYTLAVDRRYKKKDEQNADFINCVSFGKLAEVAEKYFRKGTLITICGRIQTGSYNKDGRKVYTTDIVVEEQSFAESRSSANANQPKSSTSANAMDDGFMQMPDGLDDELPFD